MISARSSHDSEARQPARLASLDALRGFDMFWIVGAEGLVAALRPLSDSGLIKALADQLEHKSWEGMHFEDLIFPLFVFIVGVSLVFSLSRIVAESTRTAAVGRIFRRAILLYALGIFYYGGLSASVQDIRLLGVLQRIALCYLGAGVLFCYLRPRGLAIACAVLLVGYWAAMTFVPVPGHGAGNFAEGRNLANYVDRWLPLRKWDGDHDPEGLLSTLPAVANCLLGVFAGLWLPQTSTADKRKALGLAGAGVAAAALGWLWHLQFPVIKKVWTSSFVLVACGYSAVLLAGFYQVIEVWKFRRWAEPFLWIGTNPITAYLAFALVDFSAIAQRCVGGDLNRGLGRYGELATALVALGLMLLLVRFLYRRKIFLRV